MRVTVATETPYSSNLLFFSDSNFYYNPIVEQAFFIYWRGKLWQLHALSAQIDLMDAHIQCPTCLDIDHLREALIDPCPECSLMSLETRQDRLAELYPEFNTSAPPAGTSLHVGSKRSASRVEKPSKKRGTSSESDTLSHQVAELANTVQCIKALLSITTTHRNVSEGTRAHVWASPFPRCELTSSFSRGEPDTLSHSASDSLDKDEHDYYYTP